MAMEVYRVNHISAEHVARNHGAKRPLILSHSRARHRCGTDVMDFTQVLPCNHPVCAANVFVLYYGGQFRSIAHAENISFVPTCFGVCGSIHCVCFELLPSACWRENDPWHRQQWSWATFKTLASRAKHNKIHGVVGNETTHPGGPQKWHENAQRGVLRKIRYPANDFCRLVAPREVLRQRSIRVPFETGTEVPKYTAKRLEREAGGEELAQRGEPARGSGINHESPTQGKC